jgi:sec-independent protein translocase protein TatA
MELFSPGHLVVLAIVVLVLFFGWKQLPDMSRSLGRSLRIFRTELKGMAQDDKKRAEAEAPKAIEAVPEPAPTVTPRPRPTPRPQQTVPPATRAEGSAKAD